MWTAETRGRVAKIRKKLKRYPTDLTDEEWSVIAPLLPQRSKKGRPRTTDLREVVNAIRYLVRTGFRQSPVGEGARLRRGQEDHEPQASICR